MTRMRSAVGVARVVPGGALVAVPVLAGPAGHDLLRVVLLDLGQERRRAAAAHRRHGAAPVRNRHCAIRTANTRSEP